MALVAASLAAAALVAEAALRFAGYSPARTQAPGELYSPRERLFLDCYPSNPRGYFDIDLRRPEVRRAYDGQGVAGVDEVAARDPFAVEFRYNSLFFRERELAPKAPGIIRVVFLGDSFTEGQGVKESDTTARRLEALLNASGERRWEVLNCARRGADFPSLHKMFEKVLPFDPDLVVHAMVLNDPERSKEFEARSGPVDDWILDRRRLLAGPASGHPSAFRPRLADFVGDRVQAWRVGRETTRWYLDLYGPANQEGWARTQDDMRDMDRRMRERGAASSSRPGRCWWTSMPIPSPPPTKPSPVSAREPASRAWICAWRSRGTRPSLSGSIPSTTTPTRSRTAWRPRPWWTRSGGWPSDDRGCNRRRHRSHFDSAVRPGPGRAAPARLSARPPRARE
ncbi:MAG: hypothetical protein DMF77_09325 [Acidobacteria bacterium]|nr:MAG: hypothetical protein DMF77_09325 [Acidobacteriota bacterium]